MKSIQMIALLIGVVFFTTNSWAQKANKETATFKVFGNCGMCKSRIETACDVKGVKVAEWDIETKQMVVVFNPEKISLTQIHEIVAACGHDTELKKAPDEAYQKLPDCCLYREKPNTHHD